MNPDTNIQQQFAPPAPAAPAQSFLPSTPDSWPGAFGVYKFARDATRIVIGQLAVVTILLLALGVVLGVLPNTTAFKVTTNVIEYVVSAYSSAVFTLLLVAGVRRHHMRLGQALRESVPLTLKMLVLSIVTTALLGVSFLLFIVPFFIVLPRLALANYYLIDGKLGILDAVQTSWRNTKGYSGRVWGIIGAKFAMFLLMITIIGIPFAVYFLVMYSAVYAVLYEFILKHPAEVAQPAAQVTAPPTA